MESVKYRLATSMFLVYSGGCVCVCVWLTRQEKTMVDNGEEV